MASPRFDILLLEEDGSALWLDAKATLNEAHSCLRALATPSGCRQYLIFDQGTGRKHFVQVNQPVPPVIPNSLAVVESAAE